MAGLHISEGNERLNVTTIREIHEITRGLWTTRYAKHKFDNNNHEYARQFENVERVYDLQRRCIRDAEYIKICILSIVPVMKWKSLRQFLHTFQENKNQQEDVKRFAFHTWEDSIIAR